MTITQTIDALPTPPDPATDSKDTYSSRASAFTKALAAMGPQQNAMAAQMNDLATAVNEDATAAQSAAAVSGAVAWVSGTVYAIGDARYSLIDFQTYRRTTAGGGATDPSLDAANWTPAVGIAPTPPLSDNSTKLATTAFVQSMIGGVLSKSVAGGVNVALTAVEAGNAFLVFTGALTANIAVIVPAAPTRMWIVENRTSGAFSLTLKTAAGSGVAVTQGKQQILASDGVNVFQPHNDFVDMLLAGNPTAPTAAQFDNDTSIATTAFVQRALGNFQSLQQFNTSQNLTAAQAGACIVGYGSTAIVLTLPAWADCGPGAAFWFASSNTAAGGVTVAAAAGQSMQPGATSTSSIVMGVGDDLYVVRGASAGQWIVLGGTAALKYSPSFASSLGASSGWKAEPDPSSPSGRVLRQWTTLSLPAYSTPNTLQLTTFGWPIAFPNAVLSQDISLASGMPLASTFMNLGLDAPTLSGARVNFAAGGTHSGIQVCVTASGH